VGRLAEELKGETSCCKACMGKNQRGRNESWWRTGLEKKGGNEVFQNWEIWEGEKEIRHERLNGSPSMKGVTKPELKGEMGG